jgi:hypothetical protein
VPWGVIILIAIAASHSDRPCVEARPFIAFFACCPRKLLPKIIIRKIRRGADLSL